MFSIYGTQAQRSSPLAGSSSAYPGFPVCVCDSLPLRETVNLRGSDIEAAKKATRRPVPLGSSGPLPYGLLLLLLSESFNFACEGCGLLGVGVCGLAVNPLLFLLRARWPDELSQFLVEVFAPAL